MSDSEIHDKECEQLYDGDRCHCYCRTVCAERDLLRARVERLEKALRSIIDYGKALQPNPVHPVTFNACTIAYEALRDVEGKA